MIPVLDERLTDVERWRRRRDYTSCPHRPDSSEVYRCPDCETVVLRHPHTCKQGVGRRAEARQMILAMDFEWEFYEAFMWNWIVAYGQGSDDLGAAE